jgi:hypothetical protein
MKMLGQDVLTQEEFDAFKTAEFDPAMGIVSATSARVDANKLEVDSKVKHLWTAIIFLVCIDIAAITTLTLKLFQ